MQMWHIVYKAEVYMHGWQRISTREREGPNGRSVQTCCEASSISGAWTIASTEFTEETETTTPLFLNKDFSISLGHTCFSELRITSSEDALKIWPLQKATAVKAKRMIQAEHMYTTITLCQTENARRWKMSPILRSVRIQPTKYGGLAREPKTFIDAYHLEMSMPSLFSPGMKLVLLYAFGEGGGTYSQEFRWGVSPIWTNTEGHQRQRRIQQGRTETKRIQCWLHTIRYPNLVAGCPEQGVCTTRKHERLIR